MHSGEDVNIPAIMSEYHPVLDIFNVPPESPFHCWFSRSVGFVPPGNLYPFLFLKIISFHHLGRGADRHGIRWNILINYGESADDAMFSNGHIREDARAIGNKR